MLFFYKNDGSVHYSGIKNEDLILNWLKNQYKTNMNPLKIKNLNLSENIKFIHMGTTKYREDIKCLIKNNNSKQEELTISVKEHKIKGTLDLINTSKIEKYLLNKENLANLYKDFNLEKDKFKSESEYEKSKKNIKKTFSFLINKFIKNNINSDVINRLFNDVKNKICDYLIIKEYNGENKIFILSKLDRDDFKFLNNASNNKYLDVKALDQGKNSANIFINNEKTYLRLRVVLNNGTKAFFGYAKKNKKSILTFKIQIDNVDKMIKSSQYDEYVL